MNKLARQRLVRYVRRVDFHQRRRIVQALFAQNFVQRSRPSRFFPHCTRRSAPRQPKECIHVVEKIFQAMGIARGAARPYLAGRNLFASARIYRQRGLGGGYLCKHALFAAAGRAAC